MEGGETSSASWGMEGSDEQSPASLNLHSVAFFSVCKQMSVTLWFLVALGLFEFTVAYMLVMSEGKWICSWLRNYFWVGSEMGWGGCSTVEGCMNHIKASVANPLAIAGDGVWWEWICRPLDLIHVNCIPFMASCLSRDLTYFTHRSPSVARKMSRPDRGITHISLQVNPPSRPLRAHPHTHTSLDVTWPVTLEVLGFDRKSIQ